MRSTPNGTPKRKYFYGTTVKELREKTSLHEKDLRTVKLDEGNTLFFAAAKTSINDCNPTTTPMPLPPIPLSK